MNATIAINARTTTKFQFGRNNHQSSPTMTAPICQDHRIIRKAVLIALAKPQPFLACRLQRLEQVRISTAQRIEQRMSVSSPRR
jgi:hypothetical protein